MKTNKCIDADWILIFDIIYIFFTLICLCCQLWTAIEQCSWNNISNEKVHIFCPHIDINVWRIWFICCPRVTYWIREIRTWARMTICIAVWNREGKNKKKTTFYQHLFYCLLFVLLLFSTWFYAAMESDWCKSNLYDYFTRIAINPRMEQMREKKWNTKRMYTVKWEKAWYIVLDD